MKEFISYEIDLFRKRVFPNSTLEEWNSWAWQMRNRPIVEEKLGEIFEAIPGGLEPFKAAKKRLPLGITPYYAAVCCAVNGSGVLSKTVLPSALELEKQLDETSDPLEEEKYGTTRNIVHKYPNRALFLTTNQCAVYCRYCTRGRLTGDSAYHFTASDWDNGFRYIEEHPEIREVIVSGGDPLLLSDDQLGYILKRLRGIPHLQIIRLGTKVPITLPQRITEKLVEVIKPCHPVFLSLHTIHPDELTLEASQAIEKLVNSGIVIASQSVLLKDVNDDLTTLKELMEKLLLNRIRPYTLYHCDQIEGAGHFRTPLLKGVELLEGLRRFSSGYAIPHYVVDPPGGKVTLAPENIEREKRGTYRLKNWEGKEVIYRDDLP